MQITTLLGSARKKGNTATVLGWVEAELERLGHTPESSFNLGSVPPEDCAGHDKRIRRSACDLLVGEVVERMPYAASASPEGGYRSRQACATPLHSEPRRELCQPLHVNFPLVA